MAVTISSEHLADRSFFHYHIGQCHGVPDDDGKIEIPHHVIRKLKQLPENLGDVGIRKFDIPGFDGKLVFRVHGWPETSAGEFMYSLNGPYYQPKSAIEKQRERLENKSLTASQL